MTEEKRGFNINFDKKDEEFFRELGIKFLISLKACGWQPLFDDKLGKFVFMILKSMGVPKEAFESGPYIDPTFTRVQYEFDKLLTEEFGRDFLETYRKNFEHEYSEWINLVFASTIDNISDEVEEFTEEIKEFIGTVSDDMPLEE